MTNGSGRRRGPRKSADELKDCLVQARVPRELQSALKQEARRRRLSVSHLIRNVLEDTVTLVDNVVTEVENLVDDSVGLAQQVRRDASHIAASAAGLGGAVRGRRGVDDAFEDAREAQEEAREAHDAGTQSEDVAEAEVAPDAAGVDPLAHVYAWNAVVLNRAGTCARCQAPLARGSQAHLGLTQEQRAAPTWLCDDCVATL